MDLAKTINKNKSKAIQHRPHKYLAYIRNLILFRIEERFRSSKRIWGFRNNIKINPMDLYFTTHTKLTKLALARDLETWAFSMLGHTPPSLRRNRNGDADACMYVWVCGYYTVYKCLTCIKYSSISVFLIYTLYLMRRYGYCCCYYTLNEFRSSFTDNDKLTKWKKIYTYAEWKRDFNFPFKSFFSVSLRTFNELDVQKP